MAAPPPPLKIGPLTEEEIRLFLAHPWVARLATVTPEGTPYVVPVWYQYDPQERVIYIVGRERSSYVAHIRATPAVAFHVADDVHREHTRVLVEGSAHIVEGPVAPKDSPRLGALVVEMSRRYLGAEGDRYARETLERPRYLIRITPRRWHTWTGAAWARRYWA